MALYLGLIFGVMLWRGISIEPQWVVLALLLVAVALGRGRAFLTDWLPFLVLFFAYEIMRGFAAKTGFVRSAAGFGEQPQVINAASDLLADVLGEAGKHSRAAVGVAELPRGVSVEIAAVFVVTKD